MKNLSIYCSFAVFAFIAASCGAPSNSNTSSNANAAKPATAAPTKESLVEMDKKANEAWFKGDKAHFEGMLSDKFVMYDQGKRLGKADMIGMIGTFKCDVKSWSLDDSQMSSIDGDTYVLSYKGTFDGTCTGPDGKAQKIPSPVRAASVWVRNGDKWQGAFHGETLIVDPNAPPAPPPPAAKEEPKKDDAKSEEKPAANSNTAAPAKPTPGANTEALVKIHTSGWEAWKAKDGKKLEEISSANLSIVDPVGRWISGRAAVVKGWIDMKCEGVNNVKIADGFATALSPTVEVLTLKGAADGTCDGQKNGDLYQTAIYVKEGDAWKLAFMFEAPAM